MMTFEELKIKYQYKLEEAEQEERNPALSREAKLLHLTSRLCFKEILNDIQEILDNRERQV